MLIVISGNPVDGFTYHGPFADRDDADADRVDLDAFVERLDADWWIASLSDPKEEGA